VAIEQVTVYPVHIVDALQVDAGCTHVSNFCNPAFRNRALHTEEPAFTVLRLDHGIDNEACNAKTMSSGNVGAWDASVRIEASRELRVEWDRNAVVNRLSDADVGLKLALDGVWWQRSCARNRLSMVRLV